MGKSSKKLTNRVRDGIVFFSGFLSRPGEVRSVAQSSSHMVDRIVRHVEELDGGLVVEFGAGMGRVTERILREMGPGGRLVCFENHPRYAEHLRTTIRDNRLTVVPEAASRAPDYLAENGMGKASHIVSTAPLRKPNADAMATAAARCLEEGGRYIQIGLWCKKSVFVDRFQYLRQELVLRNFPPEIIHVLERSPAAEEALQSA